MFAGLLVLGVTLATGTHLAVGQAEQRLDRLDVEGQSAAWRQTLANEWQRMRAEATAVTRNEALIGALRDDAGIRTYADPLYNRLRAGGIADRIVVVDAQGGVRYDSADNHGERVPLARAALEDGRFHEGLHHVPGERVYAGLAIPVYRGAIRSVQSCSCATCRPPRSSPWPKPSGGAPRCWMSAGRWR